MGLTEQSYEVKNAGEINVAFKSDEDSQNEEEEELAQKFDIGAIYPCPVMSNGIVGKRHSIIQIHRLSIQPPQRGIDVSGQCTNKEVGTDDQNKPKKVAMCKRYWGIGLTLLSSVVLSLGSLSVKLLGQYSPFIVSMWLFTGLLFPSIVVILYSELVRGNHVITSNLPSKAVDKFKLLICLFGRATAGCAAYILFNMALRYMKLPDVAVISCSAPVFVTFLGRIFLGEHCGFMNMIAALLTLIGVAVIVRPPFLTGEAELDTNLLIGASLAFGCMMCMCFVYLILRAPVIKSANYALVTLSFGIFGILECGIFSYFMNDLRLPGTQRDWLLAGGAAAATFTGQSLYTVASKYEEASVISLTRTFDVVFAFVWQFTFLGVVPNFFSLIGSMIVMSGIIFVFVQKFLMSLPKDHPIRKKLAIFLL